MFLGHTKKIIAIGGGGFTHSQDRDLEDFILSKCNLKNPKICFLPSISNGNEKKISLFYQRFKFFSSKLSHIELEDKTCNYKEQIMSQNIIYVGGGNTFQMIEKWKKFGIDKHLLKAYEKGIILSGVSAGAVCWFDKILTDSKGKGFQIINGLNFVRGSCTPHTSSQKSRLIEFKKMIKNNNMPSGFAIDDGVAIYFENGIKKKIYSSRENHIGQFIS